MKYMQLSYINNNQLQIYVPNLKYRIQYDIRRELVTILTDMY